MAEALWMNYTRISIGRKIECLTLDEKRFFQFREQDKTPDRRRSRCGQQAVVAARVQTDDGGGGKAANPVRLQPFTTESGVQVAAGFLLKLNHEFLYATSQKTLIAPFGDVSLLNSSAKLSSPFTGSVRSLLSHPGYSAS